MAIVFNQFDKELLMITSSTDGWWVEYISDVKGKRPFTPGRKPIRSAKKPDGNFDGPYCCEACAGDCVNFGATLERAKMANHGTPDERFCAWMGG